VDDTDDRTNVYEWKRTYRSRRQRHSLIAGLIEQRSVLGENAANRRRIRIVRSEGGGEWTEHQGDDHARTTARERLSAKPAKLTASEHHTPVARYKTPAIHKDGDLKFFLEKCGRRDLADSQTL